MDINRLKYILQDAGRGLTENLFPYQRSCVFCGRFWYADKLSAGLCPQCFVEWRLYRKQAHICPLCGSFDSGEPCRGPCAGKRGNWPAMVGSLASISAAAPYTGIYRQRIMAFKYNGQKQYAAPMAKLMAEAWQETRGGGEALGRGYLLKSGARPCLVPIPMYDQKEADRGYNQSRLLAKSLERETGMPVAELLVRPVAGLMQAGLNKNQRQKALDHVFQWAGPDGMKPGPVILVDDVVTTGATLESCGSLLRQHGYGPIWGLAFAGGSGAGGF